MKMLSLVKSKCVKMGMNIYYSIVLLVLLILPTMSYLPPSGGTIALNHPFSEPIAGYVKYFGTYIRYYQVGPRHFRHSFADDESPNGGIVRAQEVEGMIAVRGRNGLNGWIFARDLDPFWDWNRGTPLRTGSYESVELYLQLRRDFANEHGNELIINVYAFDGTTAIDRFFHQLPSG